LLSQTSRLQVHTDKELRAEYNDGKSRLKEAWENRYFDQAAYHVFQQLSKSDGSRFEIRKDPLQGRLLKKTLVIFERNGMNLDSGRLAQLADLRKEISALERAFQQEINEDVTTVPCGSNSLVKRDRQLAGLI
jgi:Zn-dependent oligopeptidase